MVKRVWSYINRNGYLFRYVLESLVELVFCKCLLQLFSHEYIKKKYGYFQCETLKEENFGKDRKEVNAIRTSVLWVAKKVPWKSLCLDQAMAAQRMLIRRGMANTLYLGMRKNEDKKLMAHAWVRCGDQWVVGYQPGVDYSIVGTYARVTQ